MFDGREAAGLAPNAPGVKFCQELSKTTTYSAEELIRAYHIVYERVGQDKDQAEQVLTLAANEASKGAVSLGTILAAFKVGEAPTPVKDDVKDLQERLAKLEDVDDLDYDEWVAVVAAYLTVKFLVTEAEVLGIVSYLGERLDRKEAWALLTTAGYATLRGLKFGRGLNSILGNLGYFKHTLKGDEVLGALYGWDGGA